MYTPALTDRLVTAAVPLTPVIVVGPVAVSGKLVTVAVPPLSLTTVLNSVSVAGWSLLVIVQVATSLPTRLMLFADTAAPPFLTQLQVLAV